MQLMDQGWFLYLNGLPASVPVLGKLAIVASKYGLVLYHVLLLAPWLRGSGDPDRRRRVLLFSLLATALALGVNALLNVVVSRPRPFLELPAHVLVASRPHDSSFPSDHAAFAFLDRLMGFLDSTWVPKMRSAASHADTLFS